ncbi:MAG: site-specific integrase [Pirellulales bacterium]
MSNRLPKLCFHKATGRFYVTLSDREIYLGTHRKTAAVECDRVVGEWLANGRRLPSGSGGPTDLSITELLDAFRAHAEAYYRLPSGDPTSELEWIASSVRPLRRLYGKTQAREFGPLALEVVRNEFVRQGYVRSAINARVDRIRRVFRWGVSKELIPAAIYDALRALPGLRRGRTDARERKPIRAVADAVVEATLSHLSPVVADMVRLQRLTGARPGEMCLMRPCDIDRSGEVWIYRPLRHKTEHHGQERTILIGPKAQDLLRPYLLRDPEAFCFVPAESERKRRERMHEARTTPIGYGNRPGTNRAAHAKRPAGGRYTTTSYNRAIARGCEAAFAMPKELRKIATKLEDAEKAQRQTLASEWRAEHCWSPNQLRHACATELRRRFGIESARLILGHTDVGTTQIYAEADFKAAAAFITQVG